MPNLQIRSSHQIGRFLHAAFFEFYGKAIYDGVWVGKDSPVPNINGIRKDVIDGCQEAGITALRWPGGCCADHYHWMDGVGPQRRHRLHPASLEEAIWRHDFGTDEFIQFCRLIDAEPILIANVATGTPEGFLDWVEYCNGPADSKYGAMRAENGFPEPYNVTIWGLGNTDENVWHIDSNNPVAYAQDFLRWRTAVRCIPGLRFIGLGLSERHETPGWVEGFLDHVTARQRQKGPDSLSVHHYIGGMKARYHACGPAVDFSDEAYYFTLDSLRAYQKDIDLHRAYISDHTSPRFRTTISFDEWGLWHPEATGKAGLRQPQTMRDAILAAMALHLFYRNSDIVEYAMVTQLSNLLQSLFETDGQRFYKTPTFHVLKLFKEHLGQFVVSFEPGIADPMVDVFASATPDLQRITVSAINKNLADPCSIRLPEALQAYEASLVHVIAPGNVRDQNTFEHPDTVCAQSIAVDPRQSIVLPKHSVTRLVLTQ